MDLNRVWPLFHDFGIKEGESIMWQIEPPSVPNQAVNAVLIAQTNVNNPIEKSKKRAMGVCYYAYANVGDEAVQPISPTDTAGSYMGMYELRDFHFSIGSTLTVLQAPKHGTLNKDIAQYYPNRDFIGKDVFVVQVQKGDVKVNIHYNMIVTNSPENVAHGLYGKHCGFTGEWKISQSHSGTQDYSAWLQSAHLSALIASAGNVFQGFANLAGTTVGEGTDAAIALDTTAAGHGWYFDPTPLANTDDYLPTSNPNLWKAKACHRLGLLVGR